MHSSIILLCHFFFKKKNESLDLCKSAAKANNHHDHDRHDHHHHRHVDPRK